MVAATKGVTGFRFALVLENGEPAGSTFTQAIGSRIASVPARLLLVDDDENYLDALTAMLGRDDRFEIVGRAGNGAEAVGLAAALMPDVVLMDVDMPVMDGIQATVLLGDQHPSTQVVLVSGSQFAERVFAFLSTLPVGGRSYRYLTKSRVPFELVDAILEAAAAGRALG